MACIARVSRRAFLASTRSAKLLNASLSGQDGLTSVAGLSVFGISAVLILCVALCATASAQTPTQEPTQEQTQAPTQAPTQESAQAPTEQATPQATPGTPQVKTGSQQATPGLQQRPIESVSPPPAAGSEAAAVQSKLQPLAPDRNALVAATPLWIKTDHPTRIRVGSTIAGHLMTNVYSVDHLLLPAGSHVSGRIVATPPVDRKTHREALLDGDFTPLKQPEISFDSITLPDGRTVAIRATATQRDVAMVSMRAPTLKRPSRLAQLRAGIRTRISDTTHVFTAPQKGERLRRFFYGQLLWHPQEVWSGTEYVADLTAPAMVEPANPAPAGDPDLPAPQADLTAAELRKALPTIHLEARLAGDLTSATAKQGDPVVAILTRPVFTPVDSSHPSPRLIFAEGTRLSGSVLQAKPARSWGRNGTMRFTFHSIDMQQKAPAVVEGQVAAIDGTKNQNLSVDSEGGTKSNPAKNRFLGPLTLAVLAGQGADSDHLASHAAVSGNGFGLVARLLAIAVANQGVTIGLGVFDFSKSLYDHWIAHGQNVVFLRDTRLMVDIAQH